MSIQGPGGGDLRGRLFDRICELQPTHARALADMLANTMTDLEILDALRNASVLKRRVDEALAVLLDAGRAGGADPPPSESTLASNLLKEIQAFGRLPRRTKEAEDDEIALAEKLKFFRRKHTFTSEQEQVLLSLKEASQRRDEKRLEDLRTSLLQEVRDLGKFQEIIGNPRKSYEITRKS